MIETGIHMWLTLGVIGGAIVLFASDRLPMEATSLLIVVSLGILFSFMPLVDAAGENLLPIEVLLAGFANPALIAVLALLVMGQGLFHSGALEYLIEVTSRGAARSPLRSTFIAFALIIILSAFLNNTPVVLMFIPVMTAIMQRGQISNRSLMMSVSFVSLFGGMLTLIGSSTNLLVASTAERIAGIEIGFFDQAIPGAVLMVAGIAYLIFVMPYILGRQNDRDGAKDEMVSGRQFIVEVRLKAGDHLVGAKSSAGFFPDLSGMTVQMIEGHKGLMLPPFDDYELRAGDRLFLAATRKELSDMLTNTDHVLSNNIKSLQRRTGDNAREDLMLAELVVAPGSRMISRAIYQTGFSHETDCLIIGIQRRARMLRHQLSDIRLEAGDVLLVIGNQENIQGLRGNRDALLMEWSTQELPNFANALKARFIFLATILSAALGLVPIVIAAMAGAVAMLLTGVLNIRQAARGIDLRILLIVGAALAMSESLMATGGATFIAGQFLSAFQNAEPAIILSSFFLICAFTTNILSNNATAVLFTPIAIDLALRLGVEPTAFIFAVILAANCSFATPIAYQTNLLVLSPGGYSFKDFVKAGVPLVFVIWMAFSFFAPWYYGL
jgi:di/tricarboxylate transporter